MSENILEMSHITKRFGAVKALDDVTFNVKRGEIHALVGENGAGKSTLMKVLSGVYGEGQYEGEFKVNGEVQRFATIRDAEERGIAIIHQELNLIKTMSICENIFLGNEVMSKGAIDWNCQYSRTRELLEEVHLNESVTTLTGTLGVGKQQLVEIAKALNKKAKLLILDEPTASLSEESTEELLLLLETLREKGVTCIYISHKLKEVFEIADTVTILRDGQTVTTQPSSKMTEDDIIYHMVGRELNQRFPRHPHHPGEVLLEVEGMTVMDSEIEGKKVVDNVSFTARSGEILGIAGLIGAGRTELAMSLFGSYDGKKEGVLKIDGKPVTVKQPADAIKAGLSYVSEDRKRYGLVLGSDIKTNMTLSSMSKLTHLFAIDQSKEISQVQKYMEKLKVKASSISQKAGSLSGGNQQKVILAKWLLTEPKVLILDEPTKGIDVGAKYEIYELMNQLVDAGMAIVMISSELPEILGMSDRILVMHAGKIHGEMDWESANQEKILHHAAGGSK